MFVENKGQIDKKNYNKGIFWSKVTNFPIEQWL
jgi:hypothetical protein